MDNFNLQRLRPHSQVCSAPPWKKVIGSINEIVYILLLHVIKKGKEMLIYEDLGKVLNATWSKEINRFNGKFTADVNPLFDAIVRNELRRWHTYP